MKSKFTFGILAIGALLLIGCGGGSSDSYTATYTVNGVKYTCDSEAAFNACKGGDCSSCKRDTPLPVAENPKICAVSGNTVLVNEGTTCKDGSDTLSCKDNRVTLNNSITAGSIDINGKKYICQ